MQNIDRGETMLAVVRQKVKDGWPLDSIHGAAWRAAPPQSDTHSGINYTGEYAGNGKAQAYLDGIIAGLELGGYRP